MPETLYLTVNLIDRYLATRNVTRKRLQLVGVTAMLIASKYEEIWAPEVRDFVYISDKAYSREDILGCEKTMLEVRRFPPAPHPPPRRRRSCCAARPLALPARSSRHPPNPLPHPPPTHPSPSPHRRRWRTT
jgi:hypothetical protein